MTPNDRKRFVEIVIGFAELKGKQLSGAALELYWRAMQPWTIEDFSVAAEQLLRTSQFFPMPADFNALRKAARPTAGEAWTKALEYVRRGWWRWEGGGVSNNPAIPPPPDALTTAAVNALGGYRMIAMSNEDQLPFLERRFAEHYGSIQDAEEVREALPQLAAPPRLALKGPQPALAYLSSEGDA